MKGKLREMLTLAGGEWLVSFVTRTHPGELFDRLKGEDVSIEIKKFSPGRSRDANAFCWVLCSEIGRAMTPPLAKEDVYRMAIKAVGVFTPVDVSRWDLQTVQRRWASNGTGWFLEVTGNAEPGKVSVNMYYGSSSYSKDEMRVVLDWLTDQCRNMEIPIPLSKQEEQELLERWGKRVTGNENH